MIEVPFNTTTLVVYCPFGVPTNSTASLYDQRYQLIEVCSTAEGSGEAELETAALKNAQTLALTTGHTITAGRWWLEGNDSINILRVLNDTAYLMQPLRVACADGAKILDHSITVTITGISTTTRNMILELTAEVDSQTYTWQETVHVVRQPFTFSFNLEDIAKHDPTFAQMVDGNNAWRWLVDGAIDDVRSKLLGNMIFPDLVRDREGIKQVVILTVLEKFFSNLANQELRAANFLRRVKEAWGNFLASNAWVDYDESNEVKAMPKPNYLLVG